MLVLSCIELTENEQGALFAAIATVIRWGIKNGKLQIPNMPDIDKFSAPAASFVTLLIDGDLRGCIGNIIADTTLWQSVCQNAYSSAFNDSRFLPVNVGELRHLSCEISLLSPFSRIKNQGEESLCQHLATERCGLMLRYLNAQSLYLPSVWQHFENPIDFVQALKQKAGLPVDFWHSGIEISVFNTRSYHCDTLFK